MTGSPVLTTVKSPGRGPVIPFVGLAEGDYGQTGTDEEAACAARELVVVRSDQRVFNEVVDAYLPGWSSPTTATCSSSACRLTRWRRWWSTADRGFGQPIFARGARLEDAVRIATRVAA